MGNTLFALWRRCILVFGLMPAGLAESAEKGTVRSLLALHRRVLSQKQQECPCTSSFSHNTTQRPTCLFSAVLPVGVQRTEAAMLELGTESKLFYLGLQELGQDPAVPMYPKPPLL